MPSEPPHPEELANRITGLLRRHPPTLGDAYLVCVDGPGGSGKTTLAEALAGLGAEVVHTDDMLEGWAGLPGLADDVRRLVEPLAAGRPGKWRQWDWHSSRWTATHTLQPPGLLVIEGVGAWSRAIAHHVSLLVWVEAARDTRLQRGLQRDGEAMRPHWEQWLVEEAVHFAAEGTRHHADIVVRTGD